MAKIVEIIQPSGQLDSSKIKLLHNEIISFLSRGVELILIDFQDVTYLENNSIESLKTILNKVHSYEGEFYICSLNEHIETVFEITNTKKLFNPLTNRQEFEETVLAKII